VILLSEATQAFLEAKCGSVSQLHLHDHQTKTLTADLNSAPCLQAYWWAAVQPYHVLRCPKCRRLITNLQLAELNIKSCHCSMGHSKWSSRWNAALQYIGPKHHALRTVPKQTASLVTCWLRFFFSDRSLKKWKLCLGKGKFTFVKFNAAPLSSVHYSFVLPSYVELYLWWCKSSKNRESVQTWTALVAAINRHVPFRSALNSEFSLTEHAQKLQACIQNDQNILVFHFAAERHHA